MRIIFKVSLIAAGALLLGTACFLGREAAWLPARPAPSADLDIRNKTAFFQGTIGTEIVPLPVLQVLPALCEHADGRPSHFYPFGKKGGSWADPFGFLPSSLLPSSIPVNPLAKDLPLGFTISHYRPKSAAPSPVPFVGLACATCHTTRINGKLVIGTGNSALNLFAWIDAFLAAVLDERVSYRSIIATYESGNYGPPLSLEQKGMIWLWLKGMRAKQAEEATRYGDPWGNDLSMRPENVPTGPCRTQPFRTLVRTLLQRPGTDMKVYTKIAAIYLERTDEWGQFDGGIHGLYRRSAGAALAAGATPQNLAVPEIADNVKWASDLVVNRPGPAWNGVFPDHPIDPNGKAARAGKGVYLEHCDRCHGHPGKNGWVSGELDGQLTALQEIKTDPERVTFRYYEELPDLLSRYFPKNHPFDFPRDELRPKAPQSPGDTIERGYINKRMQSAFSRAPYLHNGSILTLAELIHLEIRKPVFFRGHNEYDIKLVGLKSPWEKEHNPKDSKLYFRFDTSAPGNSNKGHDYPWSRSEVEKDQRKQSALKELLDYLKTL